MNTMNTNNRSARSLHASDMRATPTRLTPAERAENLRRAYAIRRQPQPRGIFVRVVNFLGLR